MYSDKWYITQQTQCYGIYVVNYIDMEPKMPSSFLTEKKCTHTNDVIDDFCTEIICKS